MTRRHSCSSQASVSGHHKLDELECFFKGSCESESTKFDRIQENGAETPVMYTETFPTFMDDDQAASGPASAANGRERGREQGTGRKSKHQRRKLPGSITTLMIHRLPTRVRQRDLAHELDRSGFAGLYDFLYMPCIYSSGCRQGHAFVNFVSCQAAQRCIAEWSAHRSFRIGNDQTVGAVLHISPAHIQGLDANMRKWATPKMLRVKNPNYHPLCIQTPHGSGTHGSSPCP